MSVDSNASTPTAWDSKTEGKIKVEEAKNNESDSQESGTPSWKEFTQNTTFHGVKYIFDGASVLRRLFWLVIVLGAIAFFVSQVTLRTIEYYKHQTVISVKRILADEIDFPAVTLCNLNQFRITKANRMNLYDCLNGTFGATNNETLPHKSCDTTQVPDNTSEIIAELGHQMVMLIDKCWWHGEPCDLSRDFKVRLLDIGLCFTFNSDLHVQKSISETGPNGGLQLLLNIENYEHMRGPNMDSGVKILLHEPHDKPSLKDSGFVATPGEHTYVAISHTKMETLPEPWGDCIQDGDTMIECRRKCFNEEFHKICGCRDTYMEKTPGNQCSIQEKFSCPCNDKQKGTKSKCRGSCEKSCKNPCLQNVFIPTLSSCKLSKINLDTFALSTSEKKESTKESFLNASEVQLRKSLDWQELRNKSNIFLNAFKSIQAVADMYRRSNQDGYMPYLFPLGKLLKDDLDKVFSIKSLTKARGDMTCSTNTTRVHYMTSFTSILLSIIGGAAVAMEDDPGRCTGKAEWNELYPKCEKTIKDKMNDLEWVMDNCYKTTGYPGTCGKDHVTCGCAMTSYLNDRIPPDAPMLNLVRQFYSSDLLRMTGTSNLTAGKLTEVPFHSGCLGYIDKLLQDATSEMSRVYQATEAYVTNMGGSMTFKRYMEASQPLLPAPDILNHTLGLGTYPENCCWPEYYAPTYTPSSYASIPPELPTIRKQVNKQISTAERLYKGMYPERLDMYQITEELSSLVTTVNKYTTYMDHVQRFLDDVITTKELSSNILGGDVVRLSNDLISETQIFIPRIKEILETIAPIIRNFDQYVQIVYKDMLAQLLRDQDLTKSELIQFIANNETDIVNFVSYKCKNKNFQSLSDVKEMQLYSQLICSISQYLQQDLATLDTALDLYERMYDYLRVFLSTYHQQTEMNEYFYMENFLQVDLYYEQLQYEKIEEQPSFVLGSLFSEVGGFLGLLLGASVMTVCELVDYLILLWGKRRNANRTPSSNSMT